MDKFLATQLQPGWLVKLTEDSPPARNPKDNYYNAHLFKHEIARVTSLNVSKKVTTVLLEIFDPETGYLSNRYVENAAAIFLKVKEEEYFTEKMITSMRVQPFFGTGQSITIGSDPEVFLVDATGTVIPAWKYLERKPKVALVGGQDVFWDGAQAEFTVIPATCHEQIGASIRDGLRKVLAAGRKFDPKCRLTSASVLDLPQAMLKEADDEHVALGCAPSQNAYPASEPINVPDPRMLSCRFAGCHIHMGYTKIDEPGAIRIVKAIDAIFGVISVSMFQGLEDPRRRRFYGKAGEFRMPKHGIEYRVPSSALLCHPVAMHVAFDLARAASRIGFAGSLERLWETKGDEQIRSIINDYDVDEARALLKQNDSLLMNILKCCYGVRELHQKMIAMARSMIYDGVRQSLPTDDMEKSWRAHPEDRSSGSERNLYTYTYYKEKGQE